MFRTSRVFRLPLLLCAALALAGCPGGGEENPAEEPPPDGGDGSTALYTVGGSVSGLTASSLEISLRYRDQNDELQMQDLVIQADGGFVFPAGIPDGTSFEVSFSMTADFTQDCRGENDQGTIASANVTNVDITCSKAWRVGGTVSGLEGSGLVLMIANQPGSGIPEEITANGSFSTLGNGFITGDPYSVVVDTQPRNPDQQCVVENGSGFIAEADVTDVEVRCDTATVSYTVSGLVGSGLNVTLAAEVEINGNTQMLVIERMEVAVDGTYEFETRLAPGEPYTVGIWEQPSDPDQECIVQDAEGVIAGDVTDVVVHCPNAQRIWRMDDSPTVNTDQALLQGEKLDGVLDILYSFPTKPAVALSSLPGVDTTELFQLYYDQGTTGVAHSNASGMTWWLYVVSPVGSAWPMRPEDSPRSHYASLDTYWRFRKESGDASFNLEISQVNMLAYDDTHRIGATGQLVAGADIHIRAYRVSGTEVDPEPFFNSQGGMSLVGMLDSLNAPQTKWELEKRIEVGVPTELWSFDDFELDPAAGEDVFVGGAQVFRAEQVATARLIAPVPVAVDLSALPVGAEFIVVAEARVTARNSYSPEGGALVYLRDPGAFEPGDPEGGITVTDTSGLVMLDVGEIPPEALRTGGAAPPPECEAGSTENSVLELDAAAYSVSESAELPPFSSVNVIRTGDLSGAVSARVSLAAGTAAAGQDFADEVITVHFAAGSDAPRTVELPLIDDMTIEQDETLFVTLADAAGCATIGAQATAEVTILDDDNLPGAVAFSADRFEADEGAGVATLSVVRTGGTAGSMVVTVESEDGSATGSAAGDGDYIPVATVLTFGDGEAGPLDILVPIVDDLILEADETATFTLSAALIGFPASAILDIRDNDQDQADTVQFAAAEFAALEGSGRAVITVTRYGDISGPGSVSLATSDGTAVAGEDYVPLEATIDFAAGQAAASVEIEIVEDTVAEAAETVQLSLSGPVGAALGAPASAELVISEGGGSSREWLPDVEIDAAGGAANGARVAFDDAGNAIALWYQESGGRTDIWSNRYAAGVGWEGPVLIEANDAGFAGSPDLGVAGTGAALAIWTQEDPATGVNDVWSNEYAPGQGWGTPVLVEASGSEPIAPPELAMNGGGDSAAVWSEFDGSFMNIRANLYAPGSGWATDTIVDGTDDLVDNPDVTIDEAGNVLVVWQQSDNGVVWDVWASRYVPGTGWGVPVLVSTTNVGRATRPKVAVDAAGNALAVWLQDPGFDQAVYASRFTAAGGWEAPRLIGSGDGAEQQQVAFGGDGSAIAIWRRAQNIGGANVLTTFAARYTPGGAWEAEQAISTGSVFYPKTALAANGNALAVWFELDTALPIGTGYSVWANRYTNSGWSVPEQIGSNGGLIGTGMPNLAVDPNGDAFAIWTRGGEVRVNRFE